MVKNKALTIGSLSIQAGEKIALALPTPEIYTCARTHIPIHVIRGKNEGPVLLVCAAMHGDEMNGIATIQKLLNLQQLKAINGTLIAIPVLSIYGLIMQSRNLPDRRNLENSFPGTDRGSFASRLASMLTKDIFSLATHCIDLHVGEPQSEALPQIHTSSLSSEAIELAKAFHAPVIVDEEKNIGLLWLMRREAPIPTLIYKTGEPMRLDNDGIRIGVKGIVRVMRHLNMLPPQTTTRAHETALIKSISWIRSPCSGLCRFFAHLGDRMEKGKLIARVSDPFGTKAEETILSPINGVILSKTTLPILNEGDTVVEIGELAESTPPPSDAT